MTILQKMRDLFGPDPQAFSLDAPIVAVDELSPFAYAGQVGFAGYENSVWDGGKFLGGYGETQIQTVDYWTLRARSTQLFTENMYARGLIRRLVTNEINTGLTPEACPSQVILGMSEDALNTWSELIETRFELWGNTPKVCDWFQEMTFAKIQRVARLEALVSGDVLVVLRQNPVTKLPQVQLVNGASVQTPFGDKIKIPDGHKVKHGIEMDRAGRTTAYWSQQADGSFRRIPAWGPKSGRRLAWLVFGTEKRLDDVRGMPILAIVLQSLKEIDRYRDSAQRKAVVNSILALFVKKSVAKPGTLPMQGGAVRRDQATAIDSSSGSDTPRTFNLSKYLPGMIIDELQEGEEPIIKGGEGTDINFGTFEESIIQAVAWANEIPPEILRLAFSNNYSASQAAINEFKIYLNRVWAEWGEQFCQPVYVDWLVSEALLRKIATPGLLEAWRNIAQYDTFAAWTACDWYGSIKPSTDMLKQAKGSQLLVKEGWSTNAREARVTTGTKFSKNMQRLARENRMKADAMRPLLELEKEFGTQPTHPALEAIDELEARLDEYLEDDRREA